MQSFLREGGVQTQKIKQNNNNNNKNIYSLGLLINLD